MGYKDGACLRVGFGLTEEPPACDGNKYETVAFFTARPEGAGAFIGQVEGE